MKLAGHQDLDEKEVSDDGETMEVVIKVPAYQELGSFESDFVGEGELDGQELAGKEVQGEVIKLAFENQVHLVVDGARVAGILKKLAKRILGR